MDAIDYLITRPTLPDGATGAAATATDLLFAAAWARAGGLAAQQAHLLATAARLLALPRDQPTLS